MSYMECFQKSVDYIEEHLKDKITVDDLANIAGFSPYHYYRLFAAYVGLPVMEYVRRRRLAHAAAQLARGKRVIDIALEYGFETHAGFSKAFRKVYDCSPEQYRKHSSGQIPGKVDLTLYQKLQLSGGIILEPKIISKPAFGIIGYALETTYESNRKDREIPAFWDHFDITGLEAKLYEMVQPKEHGEYFVCFPVDMDTGRFTYVAAVKGDELPPGEEGLFQGVVPEATYAVFTTPPADYAEGEFVKTAAGTWKYIFEDWFPRSGYEYAADKVEYEFYDERCHEETGAVMEIYIPVMKRE